MDAFQHLYGGGLARTVRAEQAEADPLGDGEVNPVHCKDTGVLFNQISGKDYGRHDVYGLEKRNN
jgi:hypothetical protein